jgi:hypothetical protein
VMGEKRGWKQLVRLRIGKPFCGLVLLVLLVWQQRMGDAEPVSLGSSAYALLWAAMSVLFHNQIGTPRCFWVSIFPANESHSFNRVSRPETGIAC